MRFQDVTIQLFNSQYVKIDEYDMLLCIDTMTAADLAVAQRGAAYEAVVIDRKSEDCIAVAYSDGTSINY